MASAVRRDPDQIAAALLPWLRERLPRAEAIELPPLARPAAGSSSETLLLDPLIHDNGRVRQERWVLRIQASAFQIYQDPAVERQFRTLQALAGATDVPAPQALWFEGDPAVLGAPFFVMRRVEGRVPDEMYHSAGVLADAAPQARRAMWLSALEALARIHRAPVEAFAFLDRPALGPTGLDQEIAAWDAYRRWAGTASHPTLERARRWLAGHVPAQRPTGLAWGDARLGNIVFRDDACAAVLDWETVSLGGAESDLGWWLYYDWSITEGAGAPRLEGLGGPAETIAAWEDFAGRKAEAMAWHEAFATYRFALISERAIALTEAAGGRLPVTSGDGNPAVRRLAQLLS